MNRRQVLLGGLSGCVGFLAGCPSLGDQDSQRDHKPTLEVFVVNALDASVQVTVTASRGSTEFFSHTYTLDPGDGDESESFVGTPTDVHVSIRNGRTVSGDFSVPVSCESPELNVTIEPDDILVTNGCVSA